MQRDNRQFEIVKEDSRIYYKDRHYDLAAGSRDDIDVFRARDNFFVLNTNTNLGYAGLEALTKNLELKDKIFIQNVEEEIPDLKKNFFEYSKNTQADIIAYMMV